MFKTVATERRSFNILSAKKEAKLLAREVVITISLHQVIRRCSISSKHDRNACYN